MDGGIPPHCRNQRLPTTGETTAIAAASPLECPCAIAFQNGDRSARCSTGGLPGDRCLGLGDQSDFNFFCFINIAGQDVLQRRVEFTLCTSVDFGKRCKEMGVRPSVGSVGDAYINAMAERFFASLEFERIDRRTWRTFAEARMAIFRLIEGWYNPRRRHGGLGQKSPMNFEKTLKTPVAPPTPPPPTGYPTVDSHLWTSRLRRSDKGLSPCPQASPLDNPAPEHAAGPPHSTDVPNTQSRCVRGIRVSPG